MAQSDHRRRTSVALQRPQQALLTTRHPSVSYDPIANQLSIQEVISSQLIPILSSVPNHRPLSSHVYPSGHHVQYSHGRQDLQQAPKSPGASDSSGESVISVLPTSLGLPDTAAISAHKFGASVSNSGTAYGSIGGSYMNMAGHSSIHVSTSSSSMSGSSAISTSAAQPPPKSYKVTIKNLSPHATVDMIGEVVEQKTRIYVPLVQPDPIKLRQFHGQLHAYVKFTQRDDAEKAVQCIRGFEFMSRALDARLEEISRA